MPGYVPGPRDRGRFGTRYRTLSDFDLGTISGRSYARRRGFDVPLVDRHRPVIANRRRYTVNIGRRHVFAHVLRAEAALGRRLRPGKAVVHHHTDDQLVLCEDQAYHWMLHIRTRVLRAGGNPNTDRVCSRCRQLRRFCEFYKSNVGRRSSYCKPCLIIINAASTIRRAERRRLTRLQASLALMRASELTGRV